MIRNPVVKGLLKPAGSSLGLYGRSPPARAKSENRLLPIGFGMSLLALLSFTGLKIQPSPGTGGAFSGGDGTIQQLPESHSPKA